METLVSVGTSVYYVKWEVGEAFVSADIHGYGLMIRKGKNYINDIAEDLCTWSPPLNNDRNADSRLIDRFSLKTFCRILHIID